MENQFVEETTDWIQTKAFMAGFEIRMVRKWQKYVYLYFLPAGDVQLSHCPSYLKNFHVFWNKESYLNDWVRCSSFCSCVLASWIWWKETNALVSLTFERFVRWNFLNELPASPDCLPCSLWTSCHYSSGRSFNDNGKIWRLYMTEWFVSFQIEKFPIKKPFRC